MELEQLIGKPIRLKLKSGFVLNGSIQLANPPLSGVIPFLTFDKKRALCERFGIDPSDSLATLPFDEQTRKFVDIIPIQLVDSHELIETELSTISCETENGKDISASNFFTIQIKPLDTPGLMNVRYQFADHDKWFDVGNLEIKNRSIRIPVTVAFISYAKENHAEVAEIARRLNDYGILTWFDKKELLPGDDWDMKIEQAIEKADFFLIFLSGQTIDRIGYKNKELRLALEQQSYRPRGKIFIIPILLDACEPPHDLRKLNWLRSTDDGWFDKLVKSIAPWHVKKDIL